MNEIDQEMPNYQSLDQLNKNRGLMGIIVILMLLALGFVFGHWWGALGDVSRLEQRVDVIEQRVDILERK